MADDFRRERKIYLTEGMPPHLAKPEVLSVQVGVSPRIITKLLFFPKKLGRKFFRYPPPQECVESGITAFAPCGLPPPILESGFYLYGVGVLGKERLGGVNEGVNPGAGGYAGGGQLTVSMGSTMATLGNRAMVRNINFSPS